MRDRSPGVLSLLIVMLAAAPRCSRKPTNHRSRLKIVHACYTLPRLVRNVDGVSRSGRHR